MNEENLLHKIDLTVLYPPFVRKIEGLVQACRARGVEYWATSGERTWADQGALYSLGRTKKNTDASPQVPLGSIVTKAKPGLSAHNYAIATDFCFDQNVAREGLQPGWQMERYRILAEEAVKLDLEAAFYWKTFPEGPHVQLPLEKRGVRLFPKAGDTRPDLMTIYQRGGKVEVFRFLDRYTW